MARHVMWKLAGWSTSEASLSPSSSSLGKGRGPRDTGNSRERKNIRLSINTGFQPFGQQPHSLPCPSAGPSGLGASEGKCVRGAEESPGRSWLSGFPWACSETEPAWLLSRVFGLAEGA